MKASQTTDQDDVESHRYARNLVWTCHEEMKASSNGVGSRGDKTNVKAKVEVAG